MTLQRLFEPQALMLAIQGAPLRLVRVEVLEHRVQEPAPLHQHRARLGDESGVVVVPVEPRALQVVVEGGRAEVVDLHADRVSLAAVRLERLARLRVREEVDVETERPRQFQVAGFELRPLRSDQHLRLAAEQDVARLESRRGPRELARLRLRGRQVEEHGRACLPQVGVGERDVDPAPRPGQGHVSEAGLLCGVAVGVRRP